MVIQLRLVQRQLIVVQYWVSAGQQGPRDGVAAGLPLPPAGLTLLLLLPRRRARCCPSGDRGCCRWWRRCCCAAVAAAVVTGAASCADCSRVRGSVGPAMVQAGKEGVWRYKCNEMHNGRTAPASNLGSNRRLPLAPQPQSQLCISLPLLARRLGAHARRPPVHCAAVRHGQPRLPAQRCTTLLEPPTDQSYLSVWAA